MKCHLDLESFSEQDLKAGGLYRYAEHPSTEILCICYAFDDEDVQLWKPTDTFPDQLVQYIKAGGQIRAHNAAFERIVLNGTAGQKIGFPPLQIGQMVCTMAKCAVHGLPHALGDAATALGTYPKAATGINAMRALCKPRSGKERRYALDDPKYQELYAYCADDVRAERDLDKHIPDLTAAEQKIYELDQLINDRGIAIDLAAIANAQVLVTKYKEHLKSLCLKLIGLTPGQNGKIAEWIRANGYPQLVDMTAPSVITAAADPGCPEPVRKVLKLYSTFGMKAVAKYTAMENAVCADGRLHGMFKFYGAGTGRWSSTIVQLQNLFRPVIKDTDVAIEAFTPRCLDWIRVLYDVDPMKVLSSCVRGMLVSSEGKDILALDFASIEARIVAWLAGQLDILAVFAGHGKIYEYTASRIYRIAMETVDSKQRFIGKVAVLALGYQGGVNAFKKMAKTFGVDIPEQEAEVIKVEWREANPYVVQLWYDLEQAAIAAINNPGKAFAIPNKKIMFKVDGQWLYMRLPSGRKLAYFKPEIIDQVTYLGIHTLTRQWCRVDTYGGKLLQNACEGIARDLLVNGMFWAERLGYPVIGSVHDEIIMEKDEGFGSLEEVSSAIVGFKPEWAEGLPVAAEGFRAKRYRK